MAAFRTRGRPHDNIAASELGGGTFEDGAITAGFGYLFNACGSPNGCALWGATTGTVVGVVAAGACDATTTGVCAPANPAIVGASGAAGGIIGAAIDALFGPGSNLVFSKPPANAWDPDGPKSPGYPGDQPGYSDPKGGPNWVPNPNGKGFGWESDDGKVWVPTGKGGSAHEGSHWDVQNPDGSYDNVRPEKK